MFIFLFDGRADASGTRAISQCAMDELLPTYKTGGVGVVLCMHASLAGVGWSGRQRAYTCVSFSPERK